MSPLYYIIIIFKAFDICILTDIYTTTLTISTSLVLYLYVDIWKIKWVNESGSLNLLKLSGSVQASNGTVLPLHYLKQNASLSFGPTASLRDLFGLDRLGHIISRRCDVCVTVHHWYNNINSQLDATITNFIDNYNQLNVFRAIISPVLRSTRLCLQLVV